MNQNNNNNNGVYRSILILDNVRLKHSVKYHQEHQQQPTNLESCPSEWSYGVRGEGSGSIHHRIDYLHGWVVSWSLCWTDFVFFPLCLYNLDGSDLVHVRHIWFKYDLLRN